MRFRARLMVAVVLIVILGGLVVHHGITHDEHWPHPTGDELQEDYDAFVGEQVLLFGTVEERDSNSETTLVRVTDSADNVAADLEVDGIDDSVEPGGFVQVYGILEADRTMDADQAVVVDESAGATMYKHVTSVLGIGLAIAAFFRYWRPSRSTLGFEARESSQSEGRASAAEVSEDG
ncbi:DNA-binding protein [Natronolimnobius sp. AArcel1]|uniref:DNA-binding protein n=1 Tax=Natronolimnobius sp. AArcel1 TaxID=1679093 RepID=UPI0013EDD678|nr:DNA-binding protein [Natronolimnobius sp. AArcel1]NGM69541.1 DNA-binding protein [Natronolimnobius sp. AArcel1]